MSELRRDDTKIEILLDVAGCVLGRALPSDLLLAYLVYWDNSLRVICVLLSGMKRNLREAEEQGIEKKKNKTAKERREDVRAPVHICSGKLIDIHNRV